MAFSATFEVFIFETSSLRSSLGACFTRSGRAKQLCSGSVLSGLGVPLVS